MNTTIACDAQSPDIQAFRTDYEQFREATLRSVAAETFAQDADTEDAVQTAALAVWQLMTGGRYEKKIKAFRTYFARTSINAHLKKMRQNREEPTEDLAETIALRTQLDLSDERELWARRRAWLPGAVRKLPKSEQSVVSLRLEGLSDGEISARLGTADATIPVVHSRAVSRLKKWARTAGLLGDSPNLSLCESNPC
jgi:RNA polymerase sigma factor (sigma-70 family)